MGKLPKILASPGRRLLARTWQAGSSAEGLASSRGSKMSGTGRSSSTPASPASSSIARKGKRSSSLTNATRRSQSNLTAALLGADTPQSGRYQEKSFWDAYYSNHRDKSIEWSAPVDDNTISHVLAAVKEVPMPPGGERLRILEIGCGTSSLAAALTGDTMEVVGADFSQEVINQNLTRHPTLEWHCCDALRLLEIFDPASFDCVIAKTMLDCFLTRNDSDSSIRGLLEQVRGVLRDHGRLVLLDRAGSVPALGSAGREEAVNVENRTLCLRVLRPLPQSTLANGDSGASGDDTSEPKATRWVASLPPMRDHIVPRRLGGAGVLIVSNVDEVATAAGLQNGDRLLGIEKSGSVGLHGTGQEFYSALMRKDGDPPSVLKVLIERHASSGTSRLASRRSMSQNDFIVRQQLARQQARQQSRPRQLPPVKERKSKGFVDKFANMYTPEELEGVSAKQIRKLLQQPKQIVHSVEQTDLISTQVLAAKGLFV